MPRQVPRPHPWRNALVIFGVFILLAILAALVIHFAFPTYQSIDNLPGYTR